MEKILKEIVAELKDLKSEVKDLKGDVTDLKSEVKDLKSEVKDLKSEVKDHGRRLENLENVVNELKITVNGIKEEHGQMLRAILESKEIQRGEIDTLTHRTAKIEGTLKGAATQILEDLKEVSNQ